MPLITFFCCDEGKMKRSWLEKYAMPIAVVHATGLGSSIVSWSVSKAQLKANDRVEMNKMIMVMHAAKTSDERAAAVIGLAQFDKDAIPYLVGSLQTESYPSAIRGLRTIGPRSVEFLKEKLSEGIYEPKTLLKALGDLGIHRDEATQVLESVLRREPKMPTNFFITNELNKTALLAWIKLGNRRQSVYEMQAELNGVSFFSEGIREIRGLVLRRVSLLDVDISKIDAKGADFQRTVISGKLRDGDFSNAYFQNCIIREADLSRSDFSGANFAGATLDRVNFGDAILKDAVFDGATITETSFHAADMTGATLVGTKFDPVAISAARLPPTP